jgi:hypothetical protein
MANYSSYEPAISHDKSIAEADSTDQLDSAGEAILMLLHKAAGVAETNNHRASETAQNLSNQLRAAEDRIAELGLEIQYYRGKSQRAEEWLHKISAEIEDRFVNEPVEKRRQMSQRG